MTGVFDWQQSCPEYADQAPAVAATPADPYRRATAVRDLFGGAR